MTQPYHKINGVFKRHTEGPDRGKFIHGQWAQPEFDLLRNALFVGTEKIDGTNIRLSLSAYDGALVIQGRTDKADIPPFLDEAIRATVDSKLLLPGFTYYGEGYGARIQQGGGNYRSDQGFVLFDVRTPGGYWLPISETNQIAAQVGVLHVPVTGVYTLIDWVRKMSTHWFPQESLLHPGAPAEGFVVRPAYELADGFGNRIITKLKFRDFE